MGNACLKHKKYSEALALFSRGEELNPYDASFSNKMSVCFGYKGQEF